MDGSVKRTGKPEQSPAQDIKRILVVSRMTKYCRKTVHYGIVLARALGAELHVLHVIHNPFGLEGFSLMIPSLKNLDDEWAEMQRQAKAELDRIIRAERGDGVAIEVLVREGNPKNEVLTVVKEKHIDLLITLAHHERRMEHLLFDHSHEGIIREMPCSILLVREEGEPPSAP